MESKWKLYLKLSCILLRKKDPIFLYICKYRKMFNQKWEIPIWSQHFSLNSPNQIIRALFYLIYIIDTFESIFVPLKTSETKFISKLNITEISLISYELWKCNLCPSDMHTNLVNVQLNRLLDTSEWWLANPRAGNRLKTRQGWVLEAAMVSMEIGHVETVLCNVWHHVVHFIGTAVVSDGGFHLCFLIGWCNQLWTWWGKNRTEDRISVPHAAAGSIDNVMESTEAVNRLVRDLKSSSVVSTFPLDHQPIPVFPAVCLRTCGHVSQNYCSSAWKPWGQTPFSYQAARWILQTLYGLRAKLRDLPLSFFFSLTYHSWTKFDHKQD